jgi:DNA-binding NarL/FixJ family response regulator
MVSKALPGFAHSQPPATTSKSVSATSKAAAMDLTPSLAKVCQEQERAITLLRHRRLVVCAGTWPLLAPLFAGLQPQGKPQACTGEDEGFALVRRLQPDLLICHDRLDPGQGLNLIRRCQALERVPQSILVISQPLGFRWQQSLQAGVDACCSRDRIGQGVLLEALEALAAGGIYLDRPLRLAENRDTPQLSPRQQQVLKGLAKGLDLRSLSADLGLCQSTTKGYLRQVYQKLGVHSRTQAIVKGLQTGLIEAD